MCNVSAHKGSILCDSGIYSSQDVDVSSASSVMAREICLQERYTMSIGISDSTSKSDILKVGYVLSDHDKHRSVPDY